MPADWDSCEIYALDYYVAMPVYFLSIFSNIFVLYVWGAEKKYYSVIYVFKMLSICDILQCVTYIIRAKLQKVNRLGVHLMRPLLSHRKVVPHVGVLLALVRLFRITPNDQASRILSRSGLRCIFIVIVIWCSTIDLYSCIVVDAQACSLLIKEHSGESVLKALQLTETIFNDHVGNSLPALIQGVIMIKVVYRLRKFRNERRDPRVTEEERVKASRRLEYAVFGVCAFNFLTFCLMRVLVSIFKTSPSLEHHVPILYAIITNLIGLNGCLNVVFYGLFVSTFRQLAGKRLKECTDIVSLDPSNLYPSLSKLSSNEIDYYSLLEPTHESLYETVVGRKTRKGDK